MIIKKNKSANGQILMEFTEEDLKSINSYFILLGMHLFTGDADYFFWIERGFVPIYPEELQSVKQILKILKG